MKCKLSVLPNRKILMNFGFQESFFEETVYSGFGSWINLSKGQYAENQRLGKLLNDVCRNQKRSKLLGKRMSLVCFLTHTCKLDTILCLYLYCMCMCTCTVSVVLQVICVMDILQDLQYVSNGRIMPACIFVPKL